MDIVYFYIVPLLFFGPLFLTILYYFGLREIAKLPQEIRERRKREREAAEKFERERERKRGKGPVGPVRRANTTPMGLFAQFITYAWFAAVIGVLSADPPYSFIDPGEAMIKLSLSHPGQRKGECKKRTRAELRKLPPKERVPQKCSRERWPVHVELEVDGTPVFSRSVAASGLSNDGPSLFYETLIVPAGTHRVVFKMREKGEEGFDFVHEAEMELAASDVLVAGYRPDRGLFFE